MQYIQLQPQIASQVPTPANGSLNFFLDVESNYVKTKNDAGEDITYSTITGGTYSNSTLTFFDNLGGSFSVTGITSGGGASLISISYTGLTNLIATDGLTPATSYLITDFKTCYDVPEYYVNGNPKGSSEIDYRQGNVEPIIVLATSVNTISSTAYQPAYPKDRIQYDHTFSSTNTTGGIAYGRISERIDEYNNRTDYDHRNIFFNRFQSYNKNSKLTGFLESYNSATGIVTGNGTLFLEEVSPNDVLLFDYDGQKGFKVVSATTDTELTVIVDASFGNGINFDGGEYDLYQTNITETYDEYKEVYVGQKNEGDWDDVLTFNLNGSAIHNYVGDYSKFYLNEVGSTSGFMLANNVFNGNNIYSNTIGDRSYNNTGRYWFVRNTIGGRFYNNTINQSGFYSNNIGEYFNDNIIKDSMYTNTIAEGFNNNIIEGDFYDNTMGVYFENNHTYSQFYKNYIGNSCANNHIYSDFYENKIGLYFGENIIGDLGNLDNFEFYRNVIGNNFGGNNIRQTFQNNQIGNQFNNNTINGDFYKNIIANGFKDNQNIGYDFYGNHIGNGFNGNDVIGDYFYNNQIGEYFESNNNISYNFKNNQIGNQFENNTLGNTDYFNWFNTSIENLTGRTYNTFYNSLYGDEGENIGHIILGKELIMRFYSDSGTTKTSGSLISGDTYEISNYIGDDDFTNVADVQSGNINENGCVFIATGQIPTSWSGGTELTELTIYDEYHKVKFTQWTQNNNGGGFSYERTKVYPSVESTVYFTKLNYGTNTDVIVEGRLEIKRNNNQAIYNVAQEGGWNSNQSPVGTEWNSIYTQSNNGNGFQDNIIDNEFKGNLILNEFAGNYVKSYVGNNQFSGSTYSNEIGQYTYDNDFLGEFGGNRWVGEFNNNVIGFYFYNNTFGSNISFNNISNDFQNNEIGNFFSDNIIGNGFGSGLGSTQGNKIGNNFYENTINEYFYNNYIPDNFNNNTIGNYFQWNVVNTNINDTDFTPNYGNITGFTYIASGTSATDNIYYDVQICGTTTSEFGVLATFDVEVSGGEVIGVSGASEGKLYVTGDTLTIVSNQIGGYSNAIESISDDGIGKNGSDNLWNLSATGGTGTDANFDVNVSGGLVDSVTIGDRGNGYEIGDELTIIGSLFGGTDGVDDITITVTALFNDDVVITVSGVTKPSVYETYTCQLFERQGGDKRLSFYDGNDILTITNINE
jgi:hypothetical protein